MNDLNYLLNGQCVECHTFDDTTMNDDGDYICYECTFKKYCDEMTFNQQCNEYIEFDENN